MKLLLDMYRSAPKEQRDKVQLMAAEKKAKSEVISNEHIDEMTTSQPSVIDCEVKSTSHRRETHFGVLLFSRDPEALSRHITHSPRPSMFLYQEAERKKSHRVKGKSFCGTYIRFAVWGQVRQFEEVMRDNRQRE